jgi:hypothetical protein
MTRKVGVLLLFNGLTPLEAASKFAAAVVVFLGESDEWGLAKRTCGVKGVDVDLLGNAAVLLSFAFRAGLVGHVVKNSSAAGKHVITLPLAAFVVLSLSRALSGKPLSGRKFNAEKAYHDLFKALNSDHGHNQFNNLVETFGNGGDDDNADADNGKGGELGDEDEVSAGNE